MKTLAHVLLLLSLALGIGIAAWIDVRPSAAVVGVGSDVAQSSAPAWECRFCGYSTTAYFQPKCPKCGIGMSRKF